MFRESGGNVANGSSDVFQAHPVDRAMRAVARPPAIYELNGEYIAPTTSVGQREWTIRAQNFAISIAWLAAGQVLRQKPITDEHAILAIGDMAFDVSAGGESSAVVDEPSFVVVPAGSSIIKARAGGFVMRVFSARAASVVDRATNSDRYSAPDPRVAALPEVATGGPGTLRVHPLSAVPSDPARFGRIFRTDSLLINWFAAESGPRDTAALTPHEHDDFEQASVTLAGEYVHHLRSPWTANLDEWRPDEHVQVTSPSITIIPPGILHTTRAVSRGSNELIDVFAPPRADFIARGWVLNQSDYDDNRKDS